MSSLWVMSSANIYSECSGGRHNRLSAISHAPPRWNSRDPRPMSVRGREEKIEHKKHRALRCPGPLTERPSGFGRIAPAPTSADGSDVRQPTEALQKLKILCYCTVVLCNDGLSYRGATVCVFVQMEPDHIDHRHHHRPAPPRPILYSADPDTADPSTVCRQITISRADG
ncbi:hypothetical protein K461DRAFT_147985 [Myriangium duriaei CBS 260.36]|uniref:Uncharacterized protein n=1 Tax=Myriangium duriaei CBS 260.36 TaxID=1168546 RepID=A0A9P4IZM3_9PEZI|nr:hypothetical protein K461DRAFT_147985 [Myriangium duriaei CBS 260.36]